MLVERSERKENATLMVKENGNVDDGGAYNILRLNSQRSKKEIHMEPIKTPYVVKVAL